VARASLPACRRRAWSRAKRCPSPAVSLQLQPCRGARARGDGRPDPEVRFPDVTIQTLPRGPARRQQRHRRRAPVRDLSPPSFRTKEAAPSFSRTTCVYRSPQSPPGSSHSCRGGGIASVRHTATLSTPFRGFPCRSAATSPSPPFITPPQSGCPRRRSVWRSDAGGRLSVRVHRRWPLERPAAVSEFWRPDKQRGSFGVGDCAYRFIEPRVCGRLTQMRHEHLSFACRATFKVARDSRPCEGLPHRRKNALSKVTSFRLFARVPSHEPPACAYQFRTLPRAQTAPKTQRRLSRPG